ncbi:hypothetical protein [Rhodobaculum claviforme]|uniref:Uncharacterized protein n=1 Tax=Rhodobaculum claviforme TaxID=1549854 RepID=A0A934WJZ8_9RHOB|nr:hypothetical protein [Rhodobaculum claviforme]MBK5928591.1 hypothetical protein [Rhodobaculum claviforme]
MRFWIGTAMCFAGPALAGLAQQSAASVIVYAGILFWWLLRVRPVATPAPQQIAVVVPVLLVLSAVLFAVGLFSGGIAGARPEFPFWVGPVVSVLGLFVARPRPGSRDGIL